MVDRLLPPHPADRGVTKESHGTTYREELRVSTLRPGDDHAGPDDERRPLVLLPDEPSTDHYLEK